MQKQKTIVVNLCGAPGAGKSTGAAYIFAQLKMAGVNAELITEFAKDKTWENNIAALSDQVYIFGKQHYKMSRCANQVDVIITDAPLFLSILYNQKNSELLRLPDAFNSLVLDVADRFDNMTYLLKRVKAYNPAGRSQTEAESDQIHVELKQIMDDLKINYTLVNGDIEYYNKIVNEVLNKLQLL